MAYSAASAASAVGGGALFGVAMAVCRQLLWLQPLGPLLLRDWQYVCPLITVCLPRDAHAGNPSISHCTLALSLTFTLTQDNCLQVFASLRSCPQTLTAKEEK